MQTLLAFTLGIIVGMLGAIIMIIISYILHKNKLNPITKLVKRDLLVLPKAELIESQTLKQQSQEDLINKANKDGRDIPLEELL